MGLKNGNVLHRKRWGPGRLEWGGEQVGLSGPTPLDIRDISGTGPSDVWGLATGARASHWDGARWTPSRVDTTDIFDFPQTLKAFASDDVQAALTTDKTYKWDGTSWVRTFVAPQVGVGAGYMQVLWGSAANDLWLGGSYGQLAHFNGSTWSYPFGPGGTVGIDGLFKASISRLWDLTQQELWLVGDAGRLLRKSGYTSPMKR